MSEVFTPHWNAAVLVGVIAIIAGRGADAAVRQASPSDLITISQSSSLGVLPSSWRVECATCSPGTGENQWLRRFDLPAEFGITSPVTVVGVDFGVELAGGPRGEFSVYLVLRSIPKGVPLTWENTTVISQTLDFLVSAGGPKVVHVDVAPPYMESVPFNDPTSSDLIVEIGTRDGCSSPWLFSYFYIGVNGAGETHPTYWAGQHCSVEPVVYGSRVPDNTHCMVMQVQLQVDAVTPTNRTSWGRFKGLYR